MAASTIITYLTGINYFQKVMGFKDLNTYPIINKTVLGLQKRRPKSSVKSPVNLSTLEKLITASALCLSNLYDIKAFQCYLSVQFFGLFRVSELLGDPRLKINSLQLGNLLLEQNEAVLRLDSFKHSLGKGAEITLCKQVNSLICPIKLLNSYLSVRGTGTGPLFLTSSGRPLSKRQCASQLRRCCAAAGFAANQFTSHSLRIGAATLAAQMGKSTAEIMTLGRWSSTAYIQYIRSVDPLMAPQVLSPRCAAAPSSAAPDASSHVPQASQPAPHAPARTTHKRR